MRQIALADSISKPIVIRFGSIRYPKSAASIYNGQSFGFKTLDFSVHYRTCKQIQKGYKLSELDYYNWTIEKLERLGDGYERFLFSLGKGCGLDPSIHKEINKIENAGERRFVLAALSTQKFIALYDSIMNNWEPSLSTRAILFYQIMNRRYVIIEGLHRLSILFHKYGDGNYDGFVTDSRNIRRGYYYGRFKNCVKKTVLNVRKRTSLPAGIRSI